MAALESGDQDDNDDEDESSENRRSRTILPKRNEAVDSSDKDNKGSTQNSTTIKSTTNNPIDHLLSNKIPPSQQRTSTSKLMSKSTNGGGGNGADWNEEYRWDELQTPMESALVVKLCTRLAMEDTTSHHHHLNHNRTNVSTASSSGSTIGSNNNDDLNTSDHTGTSGDELSQLTSGIRGLWRKGKEQYEEHRLRSRGSSSVNVTQKEQQAANVAQFLMKSSGSVGSGVQQQQGQGVGEEGASSTMQQDLVDYQQKWSERKNHHQQHGGGGSVGSGGMENEGTNTVGDKALLESRIGSDMKKKQQQHDDDQYHHSEGLCLGTLSIPFNKLPLEDAVFGNGAAVVERWYQLDDPNAANNNNNNSSRGGGEVGSLSGSSRSGMIMEEGGGDGNGNDDDDDEPTLLHGPRRCPSVLLEITFASTTYLNDMEDEIHEVEEGEGGVGTETAPKIDLSAWEEKENTAVAVPPTPAAEVEEKSKLKKEKEQVKKKPEEPELEPGVVDFVCIIGAKDIGDQRNDDGSKGWVQSTPECCVLERFPPNDEFHINNGRMTGLIPQVEWFCFPEGCKLWRGPNAPTHDDLKAGGVSTMSHPSLDFSSNNFDTCLDTTSSFSWFVLSSNSDVYGSKLVKTYGTIVRFYVPAPKGVDPRQDDFAQMLTGGGGGVGGEDDAKKSGSYQKRLWVPIGICLTTVRNICL